MTATIPTSMPNFDGSQTELVDLRVQGISASLVKRFPFWDIDSPMRVASDVGYRYVWFIDRDYPILNGGCVAGTMCVELAELLCERWDYIVAARIQNIRQQLVPFLLKIRRRINHDRTH